MLSFIFNSGCTKIVEVPVFITSTCPKIEVLKPVAQIEVVTDGNGTITNTSVHNLINGAQQLRKSENYYIEQVSTYNSKFTKPLDK